LTVSFRARVAEKSSVKLLVSALVCLAVSVSGEPAHAKGAKSCVAEQLRDLAPHDREMRATARAAGLHYGVPDGDWLVRRGGKRGYFYRDSSGRLINDETTLERIRSLAIPPGYHDVKISRDPKSHLQVLASDSRGREQYRYHPRWTATRAEAKFERVVEFGEAVPGIRKAVARDLAREGLPKSKVLAALVRILDENLIRVGNEEYAQANGSYGLTTLLDRHASVSRGAVQLGFKGKSGVRHRVKITDPALVGVIQDSRRLAGSELFQYVDEEGLAHAIDSADVNQYLQEVAGDGFTAKDFRTWGGTTLAARRLMEAGPATGAADAKRRIHAAVVFVASSLRNTPTVSLKSYIHPHILDLYRMGEPFQAPKAGHSVLKPEERMVLKLLERRGR